MVQWQSPENDKKSNMVLRFIDRGVAEERVSTARSAVPFTCVYCIHFHMFTLPVRNTCFPAWRKQSRKQDLQLSGQTRSSEREPPRRYPKQRCLHPYFFNSTNTWKRTNSVFKVNRTRSVGQWQDSDVTWHANVA